MKNTNLNTHSGLLITMLILMLPHNLSFSQEQQLKEANIQYERYAYVNAIDIYESVVEQGYVSDSILMRIGNAYYFNSNYNKAVSYYKQLEQRSEKDLPSEYYFRLAQSLKSIENYRDADKAMEKFLQANQTDSRAQQFQSKRDYIARIERMSGMYTLDTIKGNTSYSEFAPSFTKGGIVLSSNRNEKQKYKDTWANTPYLDVYTTKTSDTSLVNIEELPGDVNSKHYHESTTAFTKDGSTMYFTASKVYKNNKVRYKHQQNGVNTLRIYKATWNGSEWTGIIDLSINNDRYNTAHPALSPDEDILYFVSDNPEGMGRSDIYQVIILEDGTLGIPQLVGMGVNTEGRDSYPFVSKDNKLYFSSNGHYGLGGMDIYGVNLNDDYAKPINLGRPINSPKDDVTFIIDSDTQHGFLASNRDGGRGKDDIYKIKQKATFPWTCTRTLSGIVTSETGNVLSGTKITVLNENNEIQTVLTTDTEGYYNITEPLDCKSLFNIRAEKATYSVKEYTLGITTISNDQQLNFVLEKETITIEAQDDILAKLNIPIIYFDFDTYSIKPESEVDMAKVIAVLDSYPEMQLSIKSHTDSRGSKRYNMRLSQKRAEATYNYLIGKGIAKNRLSYKGFGERMPKEVCAPCTKAQHKRNRRSEFIISFSQKP